MPRCRTALLAALFAALHTPLSLAQDLPQDDAQARCDAPRLRLDVRKEHAALRQLYWGHVNALLKDESFRTFSRALLERDQELADSLALHRAAHAEGRHFEPPRRLTGDNPAYPDHLIGRSSGEGMVLMHMLVSAEGTVERIIHVDHPDLPVAQAFVDIAIQQIRTWTFSPTRIEGVAVASVVTQPITFSSPYGYLPPGRTTPPEPAPPSWRNGNAADWGAPD